PLWNHYRCADNRWIALGMLQPDRYWVELCGVLGRPELAQDARFLDMRVRAANAAECITVLDQIFATRPCAEWLALLRDGGDFIFTHVNCVDDLPTDPQVLANGYVADFDHPAFGKTQVVGLPVRLSETPGSIRMPAPEFGQHTEEILTD